MEEEEEEREEESRIREEKGREEKERELKVRQSVTRIVLCLLFFSFLFSSQVDRLISYVTESLDKKVMRGTHTHYHTLLFHTC